MPTEEQAGFSQSLKDLESPLEEVRLGALRALERIPSLAILRAVRRVATTDPSASLRFEARRFLTGTTEKLPPEASPQPKGPSTPAVGRFQALLADPDPAIRVKVIRTLVGNLDPAVPGLLASVLPKEKDPFVICTLLQALSATGESSVARLITPFLKDAEPRIRAAAVEAIEALGDLSLLVRLMPLLQDPHHRVRAAVARAMRAQEHEAVLRAVDEMLESAHEAAQRAALYVLRYFDEETAVPRLQSRLGNPSEEVRQTALASLLFLSRKGSVRAGQLLARNRETPMAGTAVPLAESQMEPVPEPLEKRFDSAEVEVRIQAVLEAVRTGRDDLMPRIRAALGSRAETRLQATLVSATGRLGTPADVNPLLPFLKSADARLRANTVEAIGLLAPGRAAEWLTPMLADSASRARANAIVALGRAAEVDVMAPLREMALEQDAAAASSAVWAASTLATAASVELLGEVVRQRELEPARAAKHALEALAPVMKEAAEALQRAANGEASSVRPAALPETKLQRLLFDLKHDSAEVRLETVKKVASVHDSRLLSATRDLLRDEDPTVRRAAREAVRAMLQNARPAKPDHAELLRFDEELVAGEERAKQALESVLDVSLKAGVAATAESLARRLPLEEHSFVRAQLISSLALLGDAQAIKLIQAFVRDPDARVRANAVDALELAGSEEDLLAAVTCLLDPDPRVRAAAIRAAAAIDKEVFLAHLKTMLASETIADRAAGLYVARTMMIPERYELLRDHFLLETQPKLYETCADALARELTAGRTAEMKALLEKLPEGNKKRYLEQAVANISQPMSAETLLKAPVASKDTSALAELSSPYSKILDLKQMGHLTAQAIRDSLKRETDPLSISFLLETAADLKLPDALELAQPFMKSRDRRVRLAAVEALGKLKSPEAVESIAALVRDRDAEVSKRALDQLDRLGPGAAATGIGALLDSGQPWAMRRGLELLEATGSPSQMALVLKTLERGGNPGIVEPVSRLVQAWGDLDTLGSLSLLYQRLPANSRPFILELGTNLGQKLGVSTDAIAARFPADSAAAVPLPAGSARAKLRAPASPPAHGFELSQTQIGVLIACSFALFGAGLWMLWPRGRALATSVADTGPTLGVEGGSRIVFQQAPVPAGSHVEYSSAPLPAAPVEAEPSVQEMEDRIKVALAPQGIKSPVIIHLMALDFLQDAYRAEIARARELAAAKQFDSATRVLEQALAQLADDHLKGRLAVLLALERTCKRAGKYEKMNEWRTQIKEVEKKLYELCAQAGRDSGISEDKVRSALVAFEQRDKTRAELVTASDFFSGVPNENTPTEPSND